MPRKLLTILLALVLLVCTCACQPAEPSENDPPVGDTVTTTTTVNDSNTPDDSNDDGDDTAVTPGSTPLLYKATDGSGNVVWLFGSIHIATEDMYPLPAYVTDAYESSDALAVECDVVEINSDLAAATKLAAMLVYTDGTKIDDHISAELYDKAVAVLKELNSYNGFLDYYMPIMWSSSIDSMLYAEYGYDADLGIDMYFLNDAKESGKEIREVESAEFQYGMLAGFSAPLQELLLASSVETYYDPLAEESLKELVDAWRGGDANALVTLTTGDVSSITDDELVLYEEYTTAMITDRNIGMTDYAEQALLSGDEVFICVGAAHIVGEGGMADLLEERGYTVETVGAA